ncbi:MAG: DUF1566 domain-containing protein [Magnetococcales bacterium]|nr:DUF1566 domain-containing protein [Magnetococcales bacterium]
MGDGTASNVHGPLTVYGQSINGQTHHASPFKVGITDVVDIAAGSQHTIAVKKDGSVWTWGRNDRNQLGRSSQHKDYYYQKKDGWIRSGLLSDSVTDRYSKATVQDADYGPLPVQVPELSGVIAVAAGDKHTLALKNDGTVWGWGYNDYGQLGNLTLGYADPPTILFPTKIIELSAIVAVAAGDRHSLALSGSGIVFAFGKNDQAQLGRSSASGWVQRTPLQIPDLTGVTAIAASGSLTVAIKNDGNVWRSYNGFDKFSEIITGLSGATAIDVGLRDTTGLQLVNGNSDYFIALKNGTVWESSLSGTNPIHATQLSGVSAIAVGDRYVVAMKNDDTIWAWGVNDYGQLGVGTFSDQPVQQPVQAIFSSVSAAAPVSSTTTTESVSQALPSVPVTSTAVSVSSTTTTVPSAVTTSSSSSSQSQTLSEKPHFTDNNDGTFTDNKTGLTWLKKASCLGTSTWANAANSALTVATLHSLQCGISGDALTKGWRLPTLSELKTLVVVGESSPMVSTDNPARGEVASTYWSSTEASPYQAVIPAPSSPYYYTVPRMWSVNFSKGSELKILTKGVKDYSYNLAAVEFLINQKPKDPELYVWPVYK